jgi:hypothetical protein
MSENEQDTQIWGVFSGENLVTQGSYEHCTAELQRRFEQGMRQFHDNNAERQRSWERAGGRDHDRDLY